jgi:NADH-quinone oxidoreductase subunit L
MFVALSLGNTRLCLFHVITHALAKANLFIVIGNLLHGRFSQQDARRLASAERIFLILILASIIRIFSLAGIVFFSGFFSKEQILRRQYHLVTRILTIIFLIIFSRGTLSYCVKLLRITLINKSVLISSHIRVFSVFPVFLLRFISVVGGIILNISFSPLSLKLKGLENIY